MYECKKNYLYHTNRIFNQNRAKEEEVMFRAKDRNQIFDQSRDEEDGDNEHVVKDEDGQKSSSSFSS